MLFHLFFKIVSRIIHMLLHLMFFKLLSHKKSFLALTTYILTSRSLLPIRAFDNFSMNLDVDGLKKSFKYFS